MSLIETKHFTISAEKSCHCVQPKPEEAPDERTLSFQSWKSPLLCLYPNRQGCFCISLIYFHLKMYTSWKKKKWGEGTLGIKLNQWEKYGQIFMKNNVQKLLWGRQRCDYGLCLLWSWERIAAQIRPERSRSQWRQALQSPQNHRSLHSQHPGSSLGSASTLLSWVSHALVQSERNRMAHKTNSGL